MTKILSAAPDLSPSNLRTLNTLHHLHILIMQKFSFVITTQEGHRLSCLLETKPNAPKDTVCILLHGLAQDKKSPAIRTLAEKLNYNVCTYDGRGAGESEGDASICDFVEAVEDLNLVSQYLQKSQQLRTETIIGHSKGGEIALLYAHLYPSRLRQVVAINVHFDLSRHDECQLTPAQQRNLQTQGYIVWKRYGPSNRPRFFIVRKEDIRLRASTSLRQVEKISSHIGILVIHGEEDEIIPKSEAKAYEELLKDRRNFSVVLLPKVKHWLSTEEEQLAVAMAINAWIKDDLGGKGGSLHSPVIPSPILKLPKEDVMMGTTPPKFPPTPTGKPKENGRPGDGIELSPALLAQFLASPDDFDLDTGMKKSKPVTSVSGLAKDLNNMNLGKTSALTKALKQSDVPSSLTTQLSLSSESHLSPGSLDSEKSGKIATSPVTFNISP